MKKAATAAVENKTYILTMRNGQLKKVTVPASWKVTFGPLVPGVKGSVHNSSDGVALRFYEGKDQQRAVFTGVADFRDSSIQIEDRVENVQQEQIRKETPNGEKFYNVEAREVKWINPDLETSGEGFKGISQNLLEDLRS